MKEKLNKEFIINLSKKKQEPSWMLEHRLQSYENFLSQDEPNFGPDIHINFDEICYYKDKTKETKKIKVTPKIGKVSDLNPDGLNSGEKNPKADCKIVYTVYSIK